MKPADYKKASAIYLIGNIFNKGITFLTVPVFTRILSMADYGIVTTYNSWCGIVSMMLGFALHMAVRSSFIDYKEKVDEYLASIVLFTVGFSVGIILAVCSLAAICNISASITLIVLCLVQGMSAAIIEDYSYYLMMKFKYKYRAVLMIAPNLLSALISIAVITLVCTNNLYLGRIVPTTLVSLGFGILILFVTIRKNGFAFNKEFIKHGLKISTPLIFHGMALMVLSQSDRIMITWLANVEQTGIYSLVYNFSMIATVITTSLDGVWVPWFTERMKTRDTGEINQMAKDYVNLITYAMCCLIMVAPEVIKILADEPYWEGIAVTPPIVLANYVIFVYNFYVNIEHFHKKTVRISIYTVIAAAINIILNFIFIPRFGYVAAAYTTLGSYMVALVLHASYAKKLEGDTYPIRTFFCPLLHVVLFVIMFYALIENPVIRWLVMIFYIGLMIVRERRTLARFLFREK